MARSRTTTVMVVPRSRGGVVALAPMSPASRQLMQRARQRQAWRSALLLLGLLGIILGTILSLTVQRTDAAVIQQMRRLKGFVGVATKKRESTLHLRVGTSHENETLLKDTLLVDLSTDRPPVASGNTGDVVVSYNTTKTELKQA